MGTRQRRTPANPEYETDPDRIKDKVPERKRKIKDSNCSYPTKADSFGIRWKPTEH